MNLFAKMFRSIMEWMNKVPKPPGATEVPVTPPPIPADAVYCVDCKKRLFCDPGSYCTEKTLEVIEQVPADPGQFVYPGRERRIHPLCTEINRDGRCRYFEKKRQKS